MATTLDDVSMLVRNLLVLGVLIAAAIALVHFGEKGGPFEPVTAPPADCGPLVPFRVEVEDDRFVFVAESVEDGPYPTNETRYELTTVRDDQDPPPAGATLAEAAEGDGPVRYLDEVPPPHELDPGDRIVLEGSEYYGLNIYTADGLLVGGNWACL